MASSQSLSPVGRTPPEVWENIFQCLYDLETTAEQKRTISSISLVSSNWTVPARRVYFRHFSLTTALSPSVSPDVDWWSTKISSQNRTPLDRFSNALETGPNLGLHILSLDLRLDNDPDSDDCSIQSTTTPIATKVFSYLTNLRSVGFGSSNSTRFSPLLRVLGTSPASQAGKIKHLGISTDYEELLEDFTLELSFLPTLTSFELNSGNGFEFDSWMPKSVLKIMLRLSSLKLDTEHLTTPLESLLQRDSPLRGSLQCLKIRGKVTSTCLLDVLPGLQLTSLSSNIYLQDAGWDASGWGDYATHDKKSPSQIPFNYILPKLTQLTFLQLDGLGFDGDFLKSCPPSVIVLKTEDNFTLTREDVLKFLQGRDQPESSWPNITSLPNLRSLHLTRLGHYSWTDREWMDELETETIASESQCIQGDVAAKQPSHRPSPLRYSAYYDSENTNNHAPTIKNSDFNPDSTSAVKPDIRTVALERALRSGPRALHITSFSFTFLPVHVTSSPFGNESWNGDDASEVGIGDEFDMDLEWSQDGYDSEGDFDEFEYD